MSAGLDRRRAELGRLGAQLAALSPLAVLDRGYAMVQRGEHIVRDAAEVGEHDRLRVRLARGALDVVVEKVSE
jgi:exodeoxyribonuclease VII large subunit